MSGSASDEAKGRAKVALGDLLDDDELRQQGRADQAAAKLKRGVENVKDKVEEGIDAARERLGASPRDRG